MREDCVCPKASVTDWRCGSPPARPFDPPQRTYSKLRVSGPSPRDGFRLSAGGCAFRRYGFTPWRICDLLLQERRVGVGEGFVD